MTARSCPDITQHIDADGRMIPAYLEAIFFGERARSLDATERCEHDGRRFGIAGAIELGPEPVIAPAPPPAELPKGHPSRTGMVL